MPKKNTEREARCQRRKELPEVLDSVGFSDVAGVQELFKDRPCERSAGKRS